MRKLLLLFLMVLAMPAYAQTATPPRKGPAIYNPTIGTSQNNPFELYIPVLGATSDNTKYLVLHNAAWGTATTHIPAGTKGMLSVYEGNIDTSQAAVDVTDNGHVFGCTIIERGGAALDCLDANVVIQTVAPSGNPVVAVSASIARNIAGGTVYGVNMNSYGSLKGDIAYRCSNTSGQPWTLCIGDQGQSAAAEKNSLSGFSGFGDSAQTNPYVLIGNTGGGFGYIGTNSNHDLHLMTHNTVAAVFAAASQQATFSGVVVPASDDTQILGASVQRWHQIWGTAYFTGAGTAGASCTVNAPAHLTVVSGIVTLCN